MRDLPMPGSPESSTTRPSPSLGLIPTAQQQLHLLLPANERGQRARAPRLEPADAGRLAAHLPRLHRLRQSLQLVGTERAAVEHPRLPAAACWPRSRPRPALPRPAAAPPGLASRRSQHAAVCRRSPAARRRQPARWRCRRAPEGSRRKRPSACRPRRGGQGRRARPAQRHAHALQGSRNRRARHRPGTGRQIRQIAPPHRRPLCGRRRSDRACPRGRGRAESGVEPTILQTMIVSCRRSGLPERTATADDAASPRAAGSRRSPLLGVPAHIGRGTASRLVGPAARAWRSP